MSSRTNYLKSNRVVSVQFQPSGTAVRIAQKLLGIRDVNRRQLLSAALIDALTSDAKLPPVRVKISATRQYHAKRGGKIVFKQYGYYKVASSYIYIQNFTPARGQPLAPKTFLDTLLHEWLHHYDTHKLKLDSIHTKGFYERLRDLKGKLGGSG